MIPELASILASQGYDQLPESIKSNYSLNEYLWLSDREKQQLVQTETEIEWIE